METEDLREQLESTAENLKRGPQDRIINPSINEPDIDEDDLGKYLMQQLRNDIADKEDMGWAEKRKYDLEAYHGIKEAWLSNYPWPNASNYPVPITPVLIDTGKAVINDLIWRDKNKVVIVDGVGEEDRNNADAVETILNWQILNDIKDIRRESRAHNYQTLLHGTSYAKIIRKTKDGYKITFEMIPIERIYGPIDAKGPGIDDSDHITQIIPLNANDLRMRLAWGVYKNLDQISKGWNIGTGNTVERLNDTRQIITGLDISRKVSRDTWFIAETYLTYYPKYSQKAIELIVHWAPSTGKICRKIVNTENLRPFADSYIYTNDGMLFHRSMPEVLRHVQQEANYVNKQVTDAADKAISPAGFYDGTTGFDPNLALRAPTGMYPVKNIGSLQWEQVNIAPIMERTQRVKDLWLEAERITGMTDLYQGVNSGVTATLGQDQMRAQKADLRSNDIKAGINDSWSRACNLIQEYNDRYMPRKTKVAVLGSKEFNSVNQLMKNQEVQSEDGLKINGNFNYSIANKSIAEDEKERQVRAIFADSILADPIFGQDISNRYKALQMKAEALGIRDLGAIVKKPEAANVKTPDEVIQSIMAGDKDVQPSVYANPAEYENRIRLYMRTGNFKEASNEIKAEFEKFLLLTIAIRKGREIAMQKFMQQQAMSQEQAMMAMAMNGNGNPNAANAA